MQRSGRALRWTDEVVAHEDPVVVAGRSGSSSTTSASVVPHGSVRPTGGPGPSAPRGRPLSRRGRSVAEVGRGPPLDGRGRCLGGTRSLDGSGRLVVRVRPAPRMRRSGPSRASGASLRVTHGSVVEQERGVTRDDMVRRARRASPSSRTDQGVLGDRAPVLEDGLRAPADRMGRRHGRGGSSRARCSLFPPTGVVLPWEGPRASSRGVRREGAQAGPSPPRNAPVAADPSPGRSRHLSARASRPRRTPRASRATRTAAPRSGPPHAQ